MAVRVTNEQLVKWQAVLTTFIRLNDDEKANECLSEICDEIDFVMTSRVTSTQTGIFAFGGEEQTADDSTKGQVPNSARWWAPAEISIIRCASTNEKAVEYYHQSEFNGKRTDNAVIQKWDKIKKTCIYMGAKVVVTSPGNLYDGYDGEIVAISDSHRTAIVRFDNVDVDCAIEKLGVIQK